MALWAPESKLKDHFYRNPNRTSKSEKLIDFEYFGSVSLRLLAYFLTD